VSLRSNYKIGTSAAEAALLFLRLCRG